MDFLFKRTKECLIAILDILEEDMNLQKRQLNELIKEDSKKEKYITDDINVVKSIIEKLDFNELSALQTIFYEMEQHFYMCNRTDEEQEDFVKGLAAEYNDLSTAKFVFEGEDEEEDDWTDWSDDSSDEE